MSDRYDALVPRHNPKSGKNYYVKVGAAFKTEKGGYSVVLDALPVPDKDGRVVILLFEPRENDRPGTTGGW